MIILIIDNYDSFTYNLVQLVGSQNIKVIVKRNDEITTAQIKNLAPDKILISPGPGRPENSKISLEAIKYFSERTPILGVCLGHQAIAYSLGGKIINSKDIIHGKTSKMKHDNKTIFRNIPQYFEATRYHSLTVDRKAFPRDLEISAETEDGTVMGLRHKQLQLEGIQFHPESILTEVGKNIINNWLKL